MAAWPSSTANVLEHSLVSPPPGSVPETSLPLTFFDVPWLLCRHMQRLYFYDFPHRSTQHLLETVVPALKRSLSLTLRRFFPFAGNLITPPPPEKPRIVYAQGDSVQFTVAESAGDFDHLLANYPRDVRELHPFVPKLPPARVDGGTRVAPLMALQVTIFPHMGICIGARFGHVAADGRAFHHFMRSWASVCKTGEDRLTYVDHDLLLPSHDRDAIKDPDGLDLVLLRELWALSSTWQEDADPAHESLCEKVRATIILGRAQIERLKRWVKDQLTTNDVVSSPLLISTFVVTCALIWVCLIKSDQQNSQNNSDEPPSLHRFHFVFVADCRNRLGFPVPETYFGNCLSPCFVALERNEIIGEMAIVAAVKAIARRVLELTETGYLEGAEKWVSTWKELGRHVVSVAGSPKLGIYESDFGWGKPRRSESVQVDASSSFSVAENVWVENGGVEVGLALNRDKMSRFNAILEQSLKLS